MVKIRINKKLQIAIITILIFVAYINILNNDFVWDDKTFILEWETKNSISNIPQLLKGELPEQHIGVYRPFRSIYYSLAYLIFNENPIGYHILSIIIHLSIAIIIYFIISQLLKNNFIAFMTSIFFGLHPINIEAVTFITTTFDLIGIMFFLLAFYLYIKRKYILSVLSAFVAFFSYEVTIILPLILILYELCFNLKTSEEFKKSKYYVPHFILAAFYLFIRFFILKIAGRGTYLAGSIYHTLLIMLKAFSRYIFLLFFPFNLNINHKISEGIYSLVWGDINRNAILAKSIFDLDIIASIILLIVILAIAFSSFKKQPLITFCIGWFFITLLPVSNIIPIKIIMAERYLYLPSVAFCILLSFFIFKLYKLNKKIAIALIILILLLYIPTIINRNKDWKDDLTLWSVAAKQNPQSAMLQFNLGNAYSRAGLKTKAIDSYKKAIDINPYLTKAYNNLAYLLIENNQLDLASVVLEKAIEFDPNFITYNHLGVIFAKKEELDLAEEYFRKSIEVNTRYAEGYNNLGQLYLKKGEYNRSIDYFKAAIKIDPNFDKAKQNLKLANSLI